MPFDVSGNFTRLYSWQTDRNNGIKILASRMDGEFDNFATGMNQVFFRDGRVPMSGTLAMGANRITGLSDGSAASPSIKFNGDANSGPFLDGLSRWGVAVNATKRFVVSASGIEVTGSVAATSAAITGNVAGGSGTFAGAGPPLTVNATDSAAAKILLQDNGVTRGKIAADGSSSFIVQSASGTPYLYVNSNGINVQGVNNTLGAQTGGAVNNQTYFDNTATYNFFTMRSWAAGVPQTDGEFVSARGDGVLIRGNSNVRIQSAGGVDIGAFSTGVGLDVTGRVKATNHILLDTGQGLPSPTAQGYINYSTANGLCLVGAGVTYDVALFNKSAAAKLVINTGGEINLLGVPAAPTAAGGTNTTQIATTAYVVSAFANSPALGGTPTAATAAAGTATTQIATTAFVDRLRGLPSQSGAGGISLDTSMRGGCYKSTGNVTVPNAIFTADDVVTVYNNSSAAITLTQGASLTLRLHGSATTGSRTLAQRGFATIFFIASNEAVVTGDVT